MAQTRELPLFPLNTVLFPGMALPLHIFEERYKLMISECVRTAQPFGVILIRSGREVGGAATIYEVGTTARITQVEHLDDGRMNIATLGYHRFRVLETHEHMPYLTGIVEDFPLADSSNDLAKKMAVQVSDRLQGYLDMFAQLGNVQLEVDNLPDDPVTLAFLTAILLKTPMKDKQQLLSTPDLVTMLKVERTLLAREAQIMKMLIERGPAWRDDPSPFSPN